MSLFLPPAPGKSCVNALRTALPLVLAEPKRDADGRLLMKALPAGAEAAREQDEDWVGKVEVQSSVPAAVEFTEPLPLYMVEVEDLARGAFLGAAAPEGWKYFIFDGPRLRGVATMRPGPGREFRLSRFSDSGRAQAMLDTICRAEKSRRVKEARGKGYELRCLEVPALHFTALWLHRASSDLILPVAGGRTAVVAPAVARKRLLAQLKQGPALIDPGTPDPATREQAPLRRKTRSQ